MTREQVEADTSRLLGYAVHIRRDAVDLSLPTWQAMWAAVPPEVQEEAVAVFRSRFHRLPHQ